MATFEELARRAQGHTQQASAPMPLIVQWASDRVQEVLGVRQVVTLKHNLELSIPGPVTSGTVTAVRGSRALTGDSTAQAAWASLPADFPQGWFIRCASTWYRIAARTQTVIELESLFAEADRAGVSYQIVKRYHELPDTVYQVDTNSFVLGRIGQPLTFYAEDVLNGLYPNRWGLYLGGLSTPHSLAEVEPAASGARQLEVYPYPSQSEMLTYNAYMEPEPYTMLTRLPLGLQVHHLLYGVIADIYEWAANASGIKEQDRQLLLNEKNRNLTRWEAAKAQAILHLSTHRHQGFVLLTPRSRATRLDRGIRTAWDEVWSRP